MMKARELMTPNPAFVTPEDSVSRAAQILRDRNVGSVPVVDSREKMRPQGIITDRDIVIRHIAEKHDRDCAVSAHMTKKPIETVDENEDLGSVMKAMKRSEVRRILVAGEGGRLVGIIAQADVAGADEIPRAEVAEMLQTISTPATPGR
jgi:CBS domain-containing protein